MAGQPVGEAAGKPVELAEAGLRAHREEPLHGVEVGALDSRVFAAAHGRTINARSARVGTSDR